MNLTKRIRPMFLAVILTIASFGQQTPPAQAPAPAPAAPAPWSAGPIDFSGLVDGYYSFNSNHPASRTNNLRFFDARANQLSLNLAKLTAEHSADPIGFRVDLGFGRGADLFNSFEPVLENRRVTGNILQAYLSLKPPKAGGLQIDFGKFATSAGAEVTETHLNWNYSRGFLYANGPFYHFGARIAKPVTSYWTAGFQLTNGWNNIEDNNSGKTVGFTSALTGKKVSLFNSYYVGPEKTDTNQGYRHFIDTVLTLAPNDKTNFYINYDYGVDLASATQKKNPFWGLGMAGRFAANSWFAVSPRYEVYNDIGGIITGTAQRLQSFTLTGEFKMQKGFLTRLEYRRDWSNAAYFDHGNELASSKNQNTLLVGFVVYFGPK